MRSFFTARASRFALGYGIVPPKYSLCGVASFISSGGESPEVAHSRAPLVLLSMDSKVAAVNARMVVITQSPQGANGPTPTPFLGNPFHVVSRKSFHPIIVIRILKSNLRVVDNVLNVLLVQNGVLVEVEVEVLWDIRVLFLTPPQMVLMNSSQEFFSSKPLWPSSISAPSELIGSLLPLFSFFCLFASISWFTLSPNCLALRRRAVP